MKDTNALTVAAEAIETTQAEISEVLRGLGRHEAFTFFREASNAATAKQFAQLKEMKAHLAMGRKNWDEFCRIDLGMDRKTVDGYISMLGEFGEKYFATAKQIRMPVDQYRLIAGQVTDDGEIEIEGEKLAFNRANAPRIKAFVEVQRKQLEAAKEDAGRAKRMASEAKKKLSDIKSRESKLFADATPAQLLIFQAESDFMRCLARLEAAQQHEDFNLDSDTETLRLICEFIWNRIAKVGDFDGPMRVVAESLNDTLVSQLAHDGKIKGMPKQ